MGSFDCRLIWINEAFITCGAEIRLSDLLIAMANLWQDWSWPHASWLFVFVNFQVTAFAFVPVRGPWKEGECERTLRRRKELFTSSWSRVGGCKWKICNLLLSRWHNQIPSLCGAETSRPQLALRWSFYTTENTFIVSAKGGKLS